MVCHLSRAKNWTIAGLLFIGHLKDQNTEIFIAEKEF